MCLAAGVGVTGTTAATQIPAAQESKLAELRAGAPTSRSSWRATIVVPTLARAAPTSKARPRMRLSTGARWNGGPVSLLVLDARQDRRARVWLRVLLPRRPSRTTGWIAADRAVVRRTSWRVVVDVDRRTVSLLRDGRVTRSWPAVVGAPSTPTPRGLFAIGERVRQPDADGFIGSWALHLVAYSPRARQLRRRPRHHRHPRPRRREPLGPARNRGVAWLHPHRQRRGQLPGAACAGGNPRPDPLSAYSSVKTTFPVFCPVST